MPVPLPIASIEEIHTPLNVIEKILSANGDSDAVEAHFASALQNNWDQVPLLNDVEHVEQLRPGSLVRFRCMVQNIYNPEWYLSEFDHVNNTSGERVRAFAKYTEFLTPPAGFTPDHGDATSHTAERTPLHCMSVPNETDWVKTQLASPIKFQPSSSGAMPRNKRALDGDAEEESMSDNVNKEQGESSMECDGAAEEAKRSRGQQASADAAAPTNADGSNNSAAQGRPALVEGAETQHAAIVKVYHSGGADGKHKVNDVVEFIGVLALDPEAAAFPGGLVSAQDLALAQQDEEMAAATGANAPTSLLPRIHAVLHRTLSAPAWNPALQRLPEAEQAVRRQEVGQRVAELREKVVGALRGALGGDALAAEYTLCHLLSRVASRPHNMPVGKMSMAISGLPHTPPGAESALQPLIETIKLLLPAVGHVPMTTKNLGEKLMVPRKDYETETLHSGALQLAPGTQLVVDQTMMEPGQLSETGVRNMSAIQALATHQLLPFDFSFYNVEFPMDVGILVASEGKPLIHVDCVVKLLPDAQQATHPPLQQQDPQVLELCQTLIGMAKSMDVELDDEICSLAENHFVSARQADAKVDQDTLNLWITLSRLMAASHGEASVSKDRWQQVMAMEATRHARLAAA